MKNNKKKKYTKEELIDIKKLLPKYLMSTIPKADFFTKNMSAAVLDDTCNPILLSSKDDITGESLITMGNDKFVVEEIFIPYFITALQQLYYNNVLKHYNGDVIKTEAHIKNSYDSLNIEYVDLNDPAVLDQNSIDLASTKLSVNQKANQLLLKRFSDGLVGKTDPLSEDDKDEILNTLKSAKESAIEMGEMEDPSESEKEEYEKKMLEKLKEVELVLQGKIDKSIVKIDVAYLKNILEKYGPEAVQEELMRLEETERDLLLTQLNKEF